MANHHSINPHNLTQFLTEVERDICVFDDCQRLGTECIDRGRRACAEHGHLCRECRQQVCEECKNMHPTFCVRAQGEHAGSGSDPVHDVQRNTNWGSPLMKKVLCATVIADVFGPKQATAREIAGVERMLRKALLPLRSILGRKGFVLRLTK